MRCNQVKKILLLLLIVCIGVQAAPAGASLKRRIEQGRELFEKAVSLCWTTVTKQALSWCRTFRFFDDRIFH
ncbi:hypothetical protein BJ742DRAFT_809953 [Cladochytrium replicatum]|nr:hypothetical protein BJ742DRAFT_809953 [Cladochytrium replicatum]